MRTLLLCVLATVACNKKTAPEPAALGSATPGSAVSPAPDAASAPAWTATSHAIELTCGDSPLELTPPQAAAKPAPDRPLGRSDALAVCRDQPSVDAVCGCLAKSVATWGKSLLLAGPATCEVQPNAQPDAAILQIVDNPAETATKSGGAALVMVAKRGATWSAVAVIDAAGDIDLAATPKLVGSLKLVSFDPHPGSMYSIETRSESRQADMGEHSIEGSVIATLCSAASGVCYTPLKLGTWTYTWTPKANACQISALALFSATFDAGGATLRLDHGSDSDGRAGRYRF
jgi:hypothetical protein